MHIFAVNKGIEFENILSEREARGREGRESANAADHT